MQFTKNICATKMHLKTLLACYFVCRFAVVVVVVFFVVAVVVIVVGIVVAFIVAVAGVLLLSAIAALVELFLVASILILIKSHFNHALKCVFICHR